MLANKSLGVTHRPLESDHVLANRFYRDLRTEWVPPKPVPQDINKEGFHRSGFFYRFSHNEGGLQVLALKPDSPAELGGLQPGDVIVGVDGQEVMATLPAYPVVLPATMTVMVVRDQVELSLLLELLPDTNVLQIAHSHGEQATETKEEKRRLKMELKKVKEEERERVQRNHGKVAGRERQHEQLVAANLGWKHEMALERRREAADLQQLQTRQQQELRLELKRKRDRVRLRAQQVQQQQRHVQAQQNAEREAREAAAAAELRQAKALRQQNNKERNRQKVLEQRERERQAKEISTKALEADKQAAREARLMEREALKQRYERHEQHVETKRINDELSRRNQKEPPIEQSVLIPEDLEQVISGRALAALQRKRGADRVRELVEATQQAKRNNEERAMARKQNMHERVKQDEQRAKEARLAAAAERREAARYEASMREEELSQQKKRIYEQTTQRFAHVRKTKIEQNQRSEQLREWKRAEAMAKAAAVRAERQRNEQQVGKAASASEERKARMAAERREEARIRKAELAAAVKRQQILYQRDRDERDLQQKRVEQEREEQAKLAEVEARKREKEERQAQARRERDDQLAAIASEKAEAAEKLLKAKQAAQEEWERANEEKCRKEEQAVAEKPKQRNKNRVSVGSFSPRKPNPFSVSSIDPTDSKEPWVDPQQQPEQAAALLRDPRATWLLRQLQKLSKEDRKDGSKAPFLLSIKLPDQADPLVYSSNSDFTDEQMKADLQAFMETTQTLFKSDGMRQASEVSAAANAQLEEAERQLADLRAEVLDIRRGP
eukprot:g51061.t1